MKLHEQEELASKMSEVRGSHDPVKSSYKRYQILCKNVGIIIHAVSAFTKKKAASYRDERRHLLVDMMQSEVNCKLSLAPRKLCESQRTHSIS